MIESDVLSDLAATRRLCILQRAEGEASVLALVLWPELPTPENKLLRADGWRVITGEIGSPARTSIVFAADAVLVGELDQVLPPVDLSLPYPSSSREFLEAVLLAAHLGVRVVFAYRKVSGGAEEPRGGKVLGVKGPLLFVADASRDGATRSFRMDGIAGLVALVEQGVPRWDGAAYAVPA